MPRPDLSETRITQILDAFEACLAQWGLEGTSLEKVAQVAGVQRSIIRHYIGNRDQLMLAYARRSVERYQTLIEEMIAALPKKNRAAKLIDYLFMPDGQSNAQNELAMDVLIAASDHNSECRKILAQFVENFVDLLTVELATIHPEAKKSDRWSVANGLVAICFSAEALTPLQLSKQHEKSWKRCAKQLINSLSN